MNEQEIDNILSSYVFPGEQWIDALDSSSVRGKEAWLLAEAFAALMDEHGSITPALAVSWIEASTEWCSLFDELDGVPAGRIFDVGRHELEDAHLLLDLGTRIVAVLPVIPIYQEA